MYIIINNNIVDTFIRKNLLQFLTPKTISAHAQKYEKTDLFIDVLKLFNLTLSHF